VVKNTLARRAVEGTEFECISPGLLGPLVFAFSQADPGRGCARDSSDFAKGNDKLIVKLVSVGGQLLRRFGDIERSRQPADPRPGPGQC
jgi:large subunit ribosomal protein L10